jgi:hypothetical protein
VIRREVRGAEREAIGMLYMIVERFKNGDPVPVYRRFRDQGRLAPAALRYVSSWVTTDMTTCYQLMECDDPSALAEWMDQWRDLADFEAVPVMTSAQAVERMAPSL